MTTSYDFALVPCTSTKNPAAVTPLSLYTGPSLRLMVPHARQRCARIVVMSAKYGLLEEGDRVGYYDTFISDLDGSQKQELMVRIRQQLKGLQGQRGLSYLWKPYDQVLQVANTWNIPVDAPYLGLPSLVLYKVLSDETKKHSSSSARRGSLLSGVSRHRLAP